MIEILIFAIIVGAFYLTINQSKVRKGKVTVGEKAAEKSDDQFNVYEGEVTESQIDEMVEKADRLHKAGAKKNSEKLYIEVIKLDPKNVAAYRGLGKLYVDLKNYEDAALSFEKTTVLDESDDQSWNNLGLVYYELRRHKKAAYAYQKAIELNGEVSHRYTNLAVIQTKMNRYDDAVETLEKSVEIDPKKETYQFLLTVYKRLGDIEKASEVKKKIDSFKGKETK